ncbi:MAG: DUF6647 family protein [Pseudomonadota bacterium]|nr:DUF6647 family protein [Pseudomonadota bacterium]
MNDILFALLTWIGTQTGYTIPETMPNIVMTERYNMCAQYGIDNKGTCTAANLAGFYDKNLTIYLRHSFDPTDANDRSDLLHELVHYVQWHNGRNNSECLGKLEVEAYELQDQWRTNAGLKPTTDPFKLIMLSASCEA